MPVNATVCGEPAALSATLTFALTEPLAVGVNVTLIVQLEPLVSVEPQVFVCPKLLELAPVIVTAMPVMVAVPLFVSVMGDDALVVESVPSVSVSDVGENVATGAVVPLRLTVCGEPVTLSAMFSVAAKVPEAPAGTNVTEMLHAPPTAMLVPHAVLLSAKTLAFAPVIVTPESVTTLPPVFVTVTICGVPLVKVSDVADRLTAGEAVATAVPASGMICVVPVVELSVTVSVAARAPVAAGVKLTVIVQLAAAASDVPQVFVSAKSPALVPEISTLEIVSGPVPVLVRFALCVAAVLATTVVPKVSPSCGSKSATPRSGAPVPLSVAVCGEFVALSTTAIDPVSAPVANGVKFTENVQLAPAASVTGTVPQVFVSGKLGLLVEAVIPVIVMAALVGFENVSVCTPALAPTGVLAKVSELAVKPTVPEPPLT